MNSELSLIIDYAKRKTNHAFLLSGEWGNGKTYFIQKIVNPLLQKIETNENAQINFSPVYISLYGVSSIDDIKTNILVSISKTKRIFGRSITKSILSTITSIPEILSNKRAPQGSAELKVILKETLFESVRWEDIVLIIDDLERAKSLKIDELLGFVNNLTEHKNAKVIIIANEDKIHEAEYKEIKEKTIGQSISFNPDIQNTLLSIIESNLTGQSNLINYLKQHIQLLVQISEKNKNNLRTFIHFVGYFNDIYSLYLIYTKAKTTQEIIEENLYRILQFSLMIAYEHKNGTLTKDNVGNIQNLHSWDINAYQSQLKNMDNKSDNNLTIAQILISKYNIDASFKFYHSIYEHICGIKVISEEKLAADLYKIHGIGIQKIENHTAIYQSLQYNQCYKITNEDYISYTNYLWISYQNELYDPLMSISIFHLIERFNNPLRLDLTSVADTMVNLIFKNKSKIDIDYLGRMHVLVETPEISANPHFESYKKIRDAILNADIENKLDLDRNRGQEFQKYLIQDFNTIISKVEEEGDSYIRSIPFQHLECPTLYNFIVHSSSYNVLFFDEVIVQAYKLSSLETKNAKFKTLISLVPKLELYIATVPQEGPNFSVISHLIQTLKNLEKEEASL